MDRNPLLLKLSHWVFQESLSCTEHTDQKQTRDNLWRQWARFRSRGRPLSDGLTAVGSGFREVGPESSKVYVCSVLAGKQEKGGSFWSGASEEPLVKQAPLRFPSCAMGRR